MAWKGSNHFRFNEAWVRIYAPAGSGVYAIYAQGRWLFIGEAEDVRGQLLRLLGGENPCIMHQGPTHFAFQSVPSPDRLAWQRELIAEYQPACNEQAVPEGRAA